MEIVVTNHAADRLHERNGFNRRSMQRMAERAFECGITEEDAKGNLYRFIANKANYEGYKIVKVYGDKAYIFAPGKRTVFDDFGASETIEQAILITVILLPQKLHKKAVKAMKRKKEK